MQPEDVRTREDFVRLVRALAEEAAHSGHAWGNPSLHQYLNAAAAWTNDMDAYLANHDQTASTEPSWRLFAMILCAATVYE